MRIPLVSLLFFMLSTSASAQYFQFSQINYTDQRFNPAVVATSDYATLNFVYRNQKTGGDFNLNSSYVSASYPFLSKRNGQRWSGVGLSLMDDRSGGIFTTQEATLSYAANIYLSKWQTLTLGAKGLYQQRRIDLEGLYTGMQYIPDRGFDEGVFSGESFSQLNNDFFTFSFGGIWQQVDRNDEQVAYISMSFFDINKPKDSFMETDSELRGAFVAALDFRAYQNRKLTIHPELLYTATYANKVLNLGAIWKYELDDLLTNKSARLDIITKYVVGRSGILGLQLHQENFSVGFSYDFPVFTTNPGNTGAFEIGFQLRRLVDPKLKARAAKQKQKDKNSPATAAQTKQGQVSATPAKTTPAKINKPDSIAGPLKKPSLKESLQSKQDSIATQAEAGNIRHEPIELERATLHFNFDFNSKTVNEQASEYLNELADALRDNPQLKLVLIGHTDNVGSDRYNLRLSQERAESIKQYLVGKGVSTERIEVEGKGMREPLNSNATEEERALNRRVELSIVYTYE